MNFLNPVMLAGMAALGVPVAIHLLNRFRVRNTDWGAMKFLLLAMRNNERRIKLQDLLLLILRLALVALAVLIFARPAVKTAGKPGDSQGPVAAMVVLDNSASMGRSLGPEICFDRAKRQIGEWLTGLDGQSLAGLILVSNRVEPVMPRPVPDLAGVRNALTEAALSDRGSDLSAGVEQAVESLQNLSGLQREIRIVTDGQAAAWTRNPSFLKLAADHPDIRFVPVIVGGDEEPTGCGIVSLMPEGGAITMDHPARFRVEVINTGRSDVSEVPVKLVTASGQPAGQSTIPRIAAGGRAVTIIEASFPAPGPNAVIASIPPDSFAADNERAFAFEVSSQPTVLVCEGNPSASAVDRGGFYLSHALAATGAGLSVTTTGVEDLTTELSPENTPPLAIFLCNTALPSPAGLNALAAYVKGGGSLVIFPGDAVDPSAWNEQPVMAELLPGKIGAMVETAEGEPPLVWAGNGFTHPITELWNDPAQGRLSAIRVNRHFPLEGKEKSRVIALLSNNSPVLLEGKAGAGSVVLWGTALTPAWSNLPLHPAFVALTQRLMNHLGGSRNAGFNFAPGELFRKEVPREFRGAELSVIAPDSPTPRGAGVVVPDGERDWVRYSMTDRAGVYRINVGPDALTTFAVQMDAAESDLTKVDPALPATLTAPPSGEKQATAAAAPAFVMRELWTPFLWVLAVFFVGEAIFAQFIGRSRATPA